MGFIRRRYRHFICLIINIFLSGTHYFRLKRALLLSCGIQLGSDTKIVGPIKISNCSRITIGSKCWIGSEFTVLGDGEVTIGNNCDLAPEVTFITGSHEIGDLSRRAGKGKLYSIIVRDGCWIGARAGLQGNITIGDASIIGSFSLVLNDVQQNCIVAGIPAHVIKEL